MANTTGKSAWSNSGAFFVALFRRQRGTVVDGQIPLAFQAVEPQRYLVGMLPRGGDTTEVCIIRVPVRHGQAFAVDDFVGWRALVQGEPQPERQDLPVGVEGRENVYSFGHTDHLYFIIQTYVRKINRENSDLDNIATNLSNVSTGLAATNIDLDPLKSNRVSHINSNVLNKVNIVLWDADTADTPFKAGNTNRGNGFCITYSSGEPYSCQLAMAVGDSHVFTRNSGPDGWSGWTTK